MAGKPTWSDPGNQWFDLIEVGTRNCAQRSTLAEESWRLDLC